jgi:hypothetical protein
MLSTYYMLKIRIYYYGCQRKLYFELTVENSLSRPYVRLPTQKSTGE